MTDVAAVVRDGVLAAVDTAHGRGPGDQVAAVLAEHLSGRGPDLADAVTVAAVLTAGELLAELADARGVGRGCIPGWFDGVGW